ncbi:MAG TPA: hypothetical protein PLU35_06215 [Phycisphaerales bacterium]|nr:hypothetical protein [Phycisphaerales bacterium]
MELLPDRWRRLQCIIAISAILLMIWGARALWSSQTVITWRVANAQRATGYNGCLCEDCSLHHFGAYVGLRPPMVAVPLLGLGYAGTVGTILVSFGALLLVVAALCPRAGRALQRRLGYLPCCTRCGYPRVGLPADTPCPECGLPYAPRSRSNLP